MHFQTRRSSDVWFYYKPNFTRNQIPILHAPLCLDGVRPVNKKQGIRAFAGSQALVARQPLSIGTLWGILVGGVGVRDGYGYGVAVTS